MLTPTERYEVARDRYRAACAQLTDAQLTLYRRPGSDRAAEAAKRCGEAWHRACYALDAARETLAQERNEP